MAQFELEKYLQSVTDNLCGQLLKLCPADNLKNPLPPEAEQGAEHLRHVWEAMHEIDCPEPDDSVMERLYQKVLIISESMEMDEDELDRVVGAGKPQEPPISEE